MVKRGSIQIFFLLMWVSFAGKAFSAEIERLRVWPAPDKTRVVFDLSGNVEYKAFTVDNPSRVVIDFKNSNAQKELVLPVRKNRLLKRVRSAKKQNKSFRVVLDLRRNVKIKSFQLGPAENKGHRLVIDLIDPRMAPQAEPQVAQGKKKKPAKQTVSKKKKQQVSEPILRDLVVAIDAGHGGKDPGASGKRGTREKDVVLSIAKKLARKINNTPGMRAVLTRERDIFLPLRKRIEIARRHNADLFISLHADAFRNHTVQGSSVYVLSEHGASSEAARWLAEKENAADFIGGVKLHTEDKLLKEVLIDLSQNAVMDASTNVAREVLNGLQRIGKVHKPTVQHAGFVVLKAPDIPSILIETAFITNPKEERKLINPSHQKKLVDAIHRGITRYFSEYAPPGTRLAAR